MDGLPPSSDSPVISLDAKALSALSHEIRAPLTSILGHLAIVADEGYAPLSDQQLRSLGMVEDAARRLMRLIGDLLSVAEVQADPNRIHLVATDLEAVAAEVIGSARLTAARRDIGLSGEFETFGPCLVDPHRFGQLIDNLVSNAIKFTPPGGRVEVRLSYRGAVVLEVEDNGMGIPPDELTQVFERFHRSAAAVRGAIPGAGLGLAVAADIASAHGGIVTVQSEEGVGSTFRVELPLRRAGTRTGRAERMRVA